MSWQPLPPWSRTTDADAEALLLNDETGRPRARVTIDLPPAPDSDGGLLDKLSSSIDRTERRHRQAAWVRNHTLPRGSTGTVQLPDGSIGTTRSGDGSSGDWLRRRYDSRVGLPDREYELRHRSRRRSDVIRDGTVVAQLRRTGGPWIRRHDALGNLRAVFRPGVPALDGGDLLMVMLAATALGPSGRRGFVGNAFGGISA